MANGKIGRIVAERGFGFIQGDDGKEYFFHRTGVPGGFDTLAVGAAVEFAVEQGDKGPRAADVRPV